MILPESHITSVLTEKQYKGAGFCYMTVGDGPPRD